MGRIPTVSRQMPHQTKMLNRGLAQIASFGIQTEFPHCRNKIKSCKVRLKSHNEKQQNIRNYLETNLKSITYLLEIKLNRFQCK